MNNNEVNWLSKWAKKTAKRVVCGDLSEAEISKMRSILAQAHNCYVSGRNGASCTYDEARRLVELLGQHPVRIQVGQARKAARWLYNVVYTPHGALRTTETAQRFTSADRDVILQIRNQEHPDFWLVGLQERRDAHGWVTFLPLYKTTGTSGSFTYMAGSWQSGGGVEIFKHAHPQK